VRPASSQPRSRVVIGLRAAGDLAALRARYGLTGLRPIPELRAVMARVDKPQLRRLAAAATVDPRIRYLSPLGPRRRALAVPNDPLLSALDPRSNLPFEWQFAAAHVDRALDFSAGSPSIVVGVIDTGLADIPDLAGKVDSRWAFSTDGQLTPLRSFAGNDTSGHGTAVASVIAANVGDGFGMAGFGGAAHVISFKADTQKFSDAALAIAIAKLDSLGVRIINMSLGGKVPASPILLDAIHKAAHDGVLIIASVGNSHDFAGHPAADLQPAGGARSYGLAVGASDVTGQLASFSNSGSHLSLLAPGDYAGSCTGVLVAIPPQSEFDRTCYPTWTAAGARYAYLAGTSFSAPEVAGVAALIWAARPELQNYQVADLIKLSARRALGAGWTQTRGCGVLDAGAALELAVGRQGAGWVDDAPLETTPCSPGSAPPTWPASQPTPTVRALKTIGSWNETLDLRFQIDEDTHKVAAAISVQRNATTIKRLKSGFFNVEPGAVYALGWHAPRSPTTGVYRFCVTLTGTSRNTSAPGCAPISLGPAR
jgi:subtilisin family serine protease